MLMINGTTDDRPQTTARSTPAADAPLAAVGGRWRAVGPSRRRGVLRVVHVVSAFVDGDAPKTRTALATLNAVLEPLGTALVDEG